MAWRGVRGALVRTRRDINPAYVDYLSYHSLSTGRARYAISFAIPEHVFCNSNSIWMKSPITEPREGPVGRGGHLRQKAFIFCCYLKTPSYVLLPYHPGVWVFRPENSKFQHRCPGSTDSLYASVPPRQTFASKENKKTVDKLL